MKPKRYNYVMRKQILEQMRDEDQISRTKTTSKDSGRDDGGRGCTGEISKKKYFQNHFFLSAIL
jgi:hypothetical protein